MTAHRDVVVRVACLIIVLAAAWAYAAAGGTWERGIDLLGLTND